MLLKIFSGIFNYNYEVVQTQTTVSKQKIVTLGTLVLLPVAIWFFSGFYLSHVLFEVNFFGGLAIGCLMAGTILIIDRAFIVLSKDNGGTSIRNFRVVIAVISTILGSLAMDLMIFSQDMEEYRTQKLGEAKEISQGNYIANNNSEVLRYASERSRAKRAWENAEKAYTAEVDGTSGTGKYGLGPAAAVKKDNRNKAKAHYDNLNELYLAETQKLENEAKGHTDTTIIKEKGAILSQIRDLHHFAFSDFVSAIYYLVIFGFFFCLEFFPFKYKSKVSESLFEKMLYAEERLGNQRLEGMIAQREEILRQDGLLGHRAENLRRLADGQNYIRKIS